MSRYRLFIASILASCLLQPFIPSAASTTLPSQFGIAYGPYRQHEFPEGLQPTEEEIREDLKLLKAILPEPRRIRVYSSTKGAGTAAILAAEEGFTVTLGAWISNDPSQNSQEITELIRLAPIVKPELVIVGNEAILREDVTPAQLKDYIYQVKAALPSAVVTTAEPWSTWILDPRGAELMDAVELLVVHVHPFWEKMPVEEAAQDVFQHLEEVRNRSGKPVLLGETGWPSQGSAQGDAVPSPQNQRLFIDDFLRISQIQDIPFFLFSAFDEPYKGIAQSGSGPDLQAEGQLGAYWGIFSWNRTVKSSLKDLFQAPDPDLSSLIFRVMTRGSLAPGFDLGFDTGLGQQDLMRPLTSDEAERVDKSPAFRLDYRSDQCWGSVFVTASKPTPSVPERAVMDLSSYDRIAIDLRRISGDDYLEIAIKNPEWPDDGTESKVVISGLSGSWQTAVIPLSSFAPTDLRRLFVVSSVNLQGMHPQTIDIAEIRYLPLGVEASSTLLVKPLLSRAETSSFVLQEGVLSCGYGLGVATADPPLVNWVESHGNFLRFAYAGQRNWASAFFTVGNSPPRGGRLLTTDLLGKTYLGVELRGKNGGEVCEIGVRPVTAGPYDRSLALNRFELSTDWKWVLIPLSSVSAENLSQIHVVASLEFASPTPSTIDVRAIRFFSPGQVLPELNPPFTWILPSAFRSADINGAFYMTDLAIANTGTSSAYLTLKFLGNNADGRSGPEKNYALAAGTTATFQDILRTVFQLDNAYGAIRISATLPSLSMFAQTYTAVKPRARGALARGSYGQGVPASASSDFIEYGFPQSIIDVRENSRFHTNLILANAIPEYLDIGVALILERGATYTQTYRLPPLGMIQARVIPDLGIHEQVDSAQVMLSTPTQGGAFAAYASVIDDSTNDPQTVLPQSAPILFGAKTWILPLGSGIRRWFNLDVNDLTVSNTGSYEASFKLKFLGNPSDSRNGMEQAYVLEPYSTIAYKDILGSAASVSPQFGAIHITSSNSTLVALGHGSQLSWRSSYGQSIPAFSSSDLILEESDRMLVGIREDSRFQTDLTLANAVDKTVDVDVQLIGDSGLLLASRRYELVPLQMVQISQVVRDLGVGEELASACIRLSTPTSDGAFAAYASVIDNITKDPRTILPR
jgi:exo-beta-1,3-glucanase (GH17 family)